MAPLQPQYHQAHKHSSAHAVGSHDPSATGMESIEIPCLPCGVCVFRFNDGKVVTAFIPEHPEHQDNDSITRRCQSHCPICKGRGRRRPPKAVKGCHFDSPRFADRQSPDKLPVATLRKQKACDMADSLQIIFKHLNDGVGPGLTKEIWSRIAQLLLPAFAEEDDHRVNKRHTSSCAYADRGISGTYTKYEGRSYLSSVTNYGTHPAPPSAMVIRQPALKDGVLFWMEDYLGARVICVKPDGELPRHMKNVPGEWWRGISLKDAIVIRTKNETEGDLSIVRQLIVERPNDKTVPVAYSVLPRVSPPRLAYFHESRVTNPTHMHAVLCNSRDTFGYSFAWVASTGTLIGIHAHKRGEDPSSFYRLMPTACYLFMPMSKDEIITDIWQAGSLDHADNTIGLRTSRNRFFYAGRMLEVETAKTMNWSLVHVASPDAFHMYYDASNHGMHVLGFENRSILRTDEPFHRKPFINYRPTELISLGADTRFYTEADLLGLLEITPCRIDGFEGITGLLLEFVEGHTEAVGHVRVDSLCDPIKFDEIRTAYMVFTVSDDGNRICKSIDTKKPPEYVFHDKVDKVVRLFPAGQLEWYWNPKDAFVLYVGQRSFDIREVISVGGPGGPAVFYSGGY